MYKVYTVIVNAVGTTWYATEECKIIHREDGPAFIAKNGNQVWYRNNVIHRDDGPAKIYADGKQSWYKNGKQHREDGPAVEGLNNHNQWYIDGYEFSESDFNAYTKRMSTKIKKEFAETIINLWIQSGEDNLYHFLSKASSATVRNNEQLLNDVERYMQNHKA